MKKRVISAVVLLAVTFVCVLLSTVSRVVYFGIIAILCAYEWGKNLRVREVNCADWVLYLMFAGLTVVTVLHAGTFWYAVVLVCAVMLSMAAGVIQQKVSGFGAMFTAAGVAYLGVLFAAILAISVSPIWLASFALGCISTWVCDSFALFGGGRDPCGSGLFQLRSDRRPRRVALQAHDRRQGLQQPDSRSRRRARPRGQPAVLHPDGLFLPARCRSGSLMSHEQLDIAW